MFRCKEFKERWDGSCSECGKDMMPDDVEVGDHLRDRECESCGKLWDAGTCKLCGFNGGVMRNVDNDKLW